MILVFADAPGAVLGTDTCGIHVGMSYAGLTEFIESANNFGTLSHVLTNLLGDYADRGPD